MSKTPITMSDVIDRLFGRLAATYGAEWTRQWVNVPVSDIKTTWGHELAGYLGHMGAIAYALDNLPERCPNAIQFRNLCRAAPRLDVQFIEQPKASAERIAAELLAMVPIRNQPKVDGKEWARRLISRHESGEVIRTYSLNLARGALA